MALFPRFNPSVSNRPPAEAAKAAKVAIADATSRGEPDNFRNNRNFRNDGPAPESHPVTGTTNAWPITDPADRIDAYYERLAKVLECGDLTETEAHLTATTEVGGTLEDLAQLQATFWRHKIEMLLQSNDPALATLLRRLCVIVRQPWVLDAARLGWSSRDLFGVDPSAPVVRIERWGLAIGLAASPHNRPEGGSRPMLCSVTSIDHERATTQTPTGAQFQRYRFASALDFAIPIWELPILMRHAKQ